MDPHPALRATFSHKGRRNPDCEFSALWPSPLVGEGAEGRMRGRAVSAGCDLD
jgi:hypothetical protein